MLGARILLVEDDEVTRDLVGCNLQVREHALHSAGDVETALAYLRTAPFDLIVLVGFDARPHTRQVIRDAWRLAHGLHADLIAVSIQPEGYLAFTSNLIGWLKYGTDAPRQREVALHRLEEHAVLAEDLGAEVIRMKSRDIAKTLVEIAKQRQVMQLVLGQPARSRWEEILRGSIINRVLRLSSDIDIHLVPTSKEKRDVV